MALKISVMTPDAGIGICAFAERKENKATHAQSRACLISGGYRRISVLKK
jgi:hypothetical protein